MASKISIRFFENFEIRAAWYSEKEYWVFSVVDIVGILSDSTNPNNYWKVMKSRLSKSHPEIIEKCHKIKLRSKDDKYRITDALQQEHIVDIASRIPGEKSIRFIKWFISHSDSIDSLSKIRAYNLFESGILESLIPGSAEALIKIHSYLFAGLYTFAGKLRTKNISKQGFMFANWEHLEKIMKDVEMMEQTTFDEIVDKYVEMNITHPFMEGNGRATRIWLDNILSAELKSCIDWSKVDKKEYFKGMIESSGDSTYIKKILKNALTSDIKNRETFTRGIDYSYYYEEDNEVFPE